MPIGKWSIFLYYYIYLCIVKSSFSLKLQGLQEFLGSQLVMVHSINKNIDFILSSYSIKNILQKNFNQK